VSAPRTLLSRSQPQAPSRNGGHFFGLTTKYTKHTKNNKNRRQPPELIFSPAPFQKALSFRVISRVSWF
jgi:hypothetical protein